MTATLNAPPTPTEPPSSTKAALSKQRSPLKQRLVDAERGVTLGLRRDSTLFVHFFAGSTVAATALVTGLNLCQWAVLLLAFSVVIAAELFQQVIKTLVEGLGHHFPETAQRAIRLGTAAAFVVIVGAALAVGMVFWQRLAELFAT